MQLRRLSAELTVNFSCGSSVAVEMVANKSEILRRLLRVSKWGQGPSGAYVVSVAGGSCDGEMVPKSGISLLGEWLQYCNMLLCRLFEYPGRQPGCCSGSTPDIGHVHEAMGTGQAETKAVAENLAQYTNSLKNDLTETNTKAQQTMEEVQRSSEIVIDANAAAKEATEIGKATMKMIRDMKLASQQNQTSAIPTYANVLARGG